MNPSITAKPTHPPPPWTYPWRRDALGHVTVSRQWRLCAVRIQARAIVAGTADADSVASALSALEDGEEKRVWRWVTGHSLLAAGRPEEVLRHVQPAAARLTWPEVKADLAIALALEKRGREAVEALRTLPSGIRVRCVECMERHGVRAGDPELDDWLRSGVTPMRR